MCCCCVIYLKQRDMILKADSQFAQTLDADARNRRKAQIWGFSLSAGHASPHATKNAKVETCSTSASASAAFTAGQVQNSNVSPFFGVRACVSQKRKLQTVEHLLLIKILFHRYMQLMIEVCMKSPSQIG